MPSETPENPYDAMPQDCPECGAPKTAANNFACGSYWKYALSGGIPAPDQAEWVHTQSCEIRVLKAKVSADSDFMASLQAVADAADEVTKEHSAILFDAKHCRTFGERMKSLRAALAAHHERQNDDRTRAS